MAHVRFSLSSSILLAAAISVMPLGTAFAQSGSQVRVTAEQSRIRTFQFSKHDLIMTAQRGAVFVVIHTHGDKYRYNENNWYMVLLPRDAWGNQRSGWISGRDVEEVPPTPAPSPVAAEDVPTVAPSAPAPVAAPDPAPVAMTPVAPEPMPTPAVDPTANPVVSDVVYFRFAKSDLTDEAKATLAGAMSKLQGNRELAIALEGHADSIGSEPFNVKLGMARAETVKRYLAEQHEIAVAKISVVSYGENQPAATNDTPEGRAQNRRVVLKVAR
jgi:outer membrane protein OmpA-like peptidoglycan-associated protein